MAPNSGSHFDPRLLVLVVLVVVVESAGFPPPHSTTRTTTTTTTIREARWRQDWGPYPSAPEAAPRGGV